MKNTALKIKDLATLTAVIKMFVIANSVRRNLLPECMYKETYTMDIDKAMGKEWISAARVFGAYSVEHTPMGTDHHNINVDGARVTILFNGTNCGALWFMAQNTPMAALKQRD